MVAGGCGEVGSEARVVGLGVTMGLAGFGRVYSAGWPQSSSCISSVAARSAASTSQGFVEGPLCAPGGTEGTSVGSVEE